jgi:hypothetical protein
LPGRCDGSPDVGGFIERGNDNAQFHGRLPAISPRPPRWLAA